MSLVLTPPEEPDPSILMVGHDRHGRWIVQENHGLLGGAFISLEAAMRFARAERQALPGATIAIAAEPLADALVH